MKNGRFFRIPEAPRDLDLMWSQARPLDATTHPRWLGQCDANHYRYVGRCSSARLSEDDRARFQQEVEELHLAGLIVDKDSQDDELRCVYIPAPQYDVWSIGMYGGDSLLQLRSHPRVANPVLSRDDVNDAAASFVADPFMIHEGGRWFMFFEVLNWRTNKGEIGLATSDDGLDWRYEQIVLAEQFHLSYPYVFKHESNYFMIPEARQSRSVRLYRAAKFPNQWTLEATLLDDVDFVDASVFRHDGRWWMFVGDNTGAGHDTLRLFAAESLTTTWNEHPASPLVQGNPQIARPGGRVLVVGQQIIRFAQNCQTEYGLDVRAFELMHLSTSEYRERPLASAPLLAAGNETWNAGGMHHIDAHPLADGTWLACVDGWNSRSAAVGPRSCPS